MPKPIHLALPVLLFCLSSPDALAVYRCESDGKTIYTDLPCNGARLPPPDPAPRPTDDNDTLKRERSELAKLQKLREQRERQESQIRDLAARGAAAREKKCRTLALQLKWREEDLREATVDKTRSARTRARRAAEKYQSECR